MHADPEHVDVQEAAQKAIADIHLALSESPCPYLPDRMARNEAYFVDALTPESYRKLLNMGFRRSGRLVYRPQCRSCNECRQLRIPVRSFAPTRSMHRVARRNRDVRVELQPPAPTADTHAMFVRYLDDQHDDTMSRGLDDMISFLYDSPLDTIEAVYRIGQRTVGISILDPVDDGLSSVYMFFDPDFADRSLGTFSTLWEIRQCAEQGLDHYYLGFHVAGSKTMDYKARFRPNEVLAGADRWVPLGTGNGRG